MLCLHDATVEAGTQLDVPGNAYSFTAGFPSPLQPPEEIVAYFREHAARVRVCAPGGASEFDEAFFQFGSAIPLGIYTATMTSRLRFLGVRAAGVESRSSEASPPAF